MSDQAPFVITISRVRKEFDVTAEKAEELIQSGDHMRGRYLRRLTGADWTDARQYHLSLDTGVLGFKMAEDIVVESALARFQGVVV